jgi:predicted  nucleic acid-binding Zn-ribbon protein
MTAPVTPASDRSAGTYVCMRCTNRLTVVSATRLSPCPVCGGHDWQSADDETRALPAAAVEADRARAPAPGVAQPRGL